MQCFKCRCCRDLSVAAPEFYFFRGSPNHRGDSAAALLASFPTASKQIQASGAKTAETLEGAGTTLRDLRAHSFLAAFVMGFGNDHDGYEDESDDEV